MARREAPAFSRGNAAQKNNGCATWRAISLALGRGKRKKAPLRGESDGAPGAAKKQGGGALAKAV